MKKIMIIGSLNIDFVVEVEEMPEAGETILAQSYTKIPGGKGANQAFAAGKLGADITMLGAVGSDENGTELLNSLKSANVCTEYIKIDETENTGIAWITVSQAGENSITVVQGANRKVDKAYIDKHIEEIKKTDIVILQLEIPLDTVIYAAKLAKTYGKTVILDPAPAQRKLPNELLSCVDIIKPNETELQILMDLENAEEDLENSTNLLKQRGIKNVIVTLGGKGAYLNSADGTKEFFPSEKVQVVDTTAAGDTFTAAIAVKLADDEALSKAIEFANRAAAITVTRKGAQSSIPSLAEVKQAAGRQA